MLFCVCDPIVALFHELNCVNLEWTAVPTYWVSIQLPTVNVSTVLITWPIAKYGYFEYFLSWICFGVGISFVSSVSCLSGIAWIVGFFFFLFFRTRWFSLHRTEQIYIAEMFALAFVYTYFISRLLFGFIARLSQFSIQHIAEMLLCICLSVVYFWTEWRERGWRRRRYALFW